MVELHDYREVDVYSFGVMVLEIFCGWKNLDRSQSEDDAHLLGVFKRKQKTVSFLIWSIKTMRIRSCMDPK